MLIIEPVSTPYIFWTLTIAGMIIFMLLYMPYDLSFGGLPLVNQ
jgi:hypothetical protein